MAAAEEMSAAAEAVEQARETRKLFVGGVATSAQETDLLDHFARFGAVRSVMVMRDRETDSSSSRARTPPPGRSAPETSPGTTSAAARCRWKNSILPEVVPELLSSGGSTLHDLAVWRGFLKETPWFQGLPAAGVM